MVKKQRLGYIRSRSIPISNMRILALALCMLVLAIPLSIHNILRVISNFSLNWPNVHRTDLNAYSIEIDSQLVHGVFH